LEHRLKHLVIIITALAATVCQAQKTISADDALALAAKNRLALKAAKLNIEQAKRDSKAKSAYAPTTLGIGASSRTEVGASDGDLFVSQPIDIFGRALAGQRVGSASVQLALAEYVEVAEDLQSEALSAYAEAVATAHQKDVADELLKIAEGLLSATKRRFEEGKVAEIHLTRATIEFERAKQSAALQTAAQVASLQRLSGQLAVDPSELAVEADATIAPLTNPNPVNRPDLLTLAAQAKVAEAEAGVARVSNRPELDFQLRRSPWNDNPSYFGARIQLTWSFWDHGKSNLESKAAQSRAEAARKLLEDAQGKAKAELKAIATELAANQKQIAGYEGILVSARTLVSKSQTAYSEGFGTQVDVLEAARALREVEQELVAARLRLSQTVIAQYKAAGFLAEVLK
jgi:outer membrane protein TolC